MISINVTGFSFLSTQKIAEKRFKSQRYMAPFGRSPNLFADPNSSILSAKSSRRISRMTNSVRMFDRGFVEQLRRLVIRNSRVFQSRHVLCPANSKNIINGDYYSQTIVTTCHSDDSPEFYIPQKSRRTSTCHGNSFFSSCMRKHARRQQQYQFDGFAYYPFEEHFRSPKAAGM